MSFGVRDLVRLNTVCWAIEINLNINILHVHESRIIMYYTVQGKNNKSAD